MPLPGLSFLAPRAARAHGPADPDPDAGRPVPDEPGGHAAVPPADAALAAFLANRDDNRFFGVHATWEEAEAAAASYGTSGYDNAPSAALYRHRVRMDAHDWPALAWLLRSAVDGHRRVFDVGGATGIKWLAFREALAPWPDIDWLVQDVPAMVAEGRRLAAQRQATGDPAAAADRSLRFTDRFDDGLGCDLLLASGVLQYLRFPLGTMLARWPRERLPRRIVVNTAALHPTARYVTVNSLGTAFVPYRVQTQADVVQPLAAIGYRPRDSWILPGKTLDLPGRPELSLAAYGGLVLDLAP